MDDDVREAANQKIDELEKEIQRLRDLAVKRETRMQAIYKENESLQAQIKSAVEILGYPTEE